jgi:hypothetical protein
MSCDCVSGKWSCIYSGDAASGVGGSCGLGGAGGTGGAGGAGGAADAGR